ncbi:MAG: hypothetical protein GC164_14520 [Phycisphaera sp.]|nr:hypothetical protein [Phycisphaera sp.]
MPRTRIVSNTPNVTYQGRHRFEHWYRDNQVYFISVKCHDAVHALASERAKAIFWERFEHYTAQHGFVPWVTSLLDNHYHTLGYLRLGESLGPMMRHIHGSTAKLINDTLPQRLKPFWAQKVRGDYFDGCIRDETQCRRAYVYTLRQSVRHGIVKDWRTYPHTHVRVELDAGVKRALDLKAFLEGVPYKRYMQSPKQGPKPEAHGH